MKSVRDWVKSRKREEISRVREFLSHQKISRKRIRNKRAKQRKKSEKRTLKIKILRTDSVKKNLI